MPPRERIVRVAAVPRGERGDADSVVARLEVGAGAGDAVASAVRDAVAAADSSVAVTGRATGPVALLRTTPTAAQAAAATAIASTDHAARPAPVRHQTVRSLIPSLWHVVRAAALNRFLSPD